MAALASVGPSHVALSRRFARLPLSQTTFEGETMVSKAASERAVEAALKRGYTRGYEAAKDKFAPPSRPAYQQRDPTPFEQLPRDKQLLIAAHTVAFGTTAIQDAAKSMEWARDFLATGMKMLDDLLSEVELLATHPFASADTHPKDGDATEIAAPLVSGAVPEADAQQ